MAGESGASVSDELGGSMTTDSPSQSGSGGAARAGTTSRGGAGGASDRPAEGGDAPGPGGSDGEGGAQVVPSAGGDASEGGSGGTKQPMGGTHSGTAGSSTSAGAGSGGAAGTGSNGSGGGGAAGSSGTGTGGEPPVTSAGEQCAKCGANECGTLLTACTKNAECAPWLTCLRSCDSSSCVAACDAAHADVARVYDDVYACLCDTCATSCEVAQACDKQCSDEGALPPITTAPATLAETGLYASAMTVRSDVYAYQVKYPLWSDGATKERFVYVPPCETIDTADMDHWEFPIGTRLWKNFSVDGKRVETRFLHRYGAGAADWLYATYGWDAAKQNDPRAAAIVLHGMPNANGTTHDIPDPWECTACHGKLPDKPLGFSAFQLSHTGEGLTMKKLSQLGWLSAPAPQGFIAPGTPTQQAALGYLHANCGGCHNSAGEIPRDNPMKLRLLVAQTDYADTDTVLTTIGIPTSNADPALHGKPRIAPQDPTGSAIFLRMSNRDSYPMPPIASELADTSGGVAAVKAWIESLPQP